MDAIERLFHEIAASAPQANRPRVTLTWAQSLDGSLAGEGGKPLALSGRASLAFTHRLRAAHDAILVGVGALLADDPQLTVRFAEGRHPQPVILDSRLRTPLTARLLSGPRPPWIFTSAAADPQRWAALRAREAILFAVPQAPDDGLSLPSVLNTLAAQGVRRLMVEGGAQVIASFLAQDVVDWAVVTLAPRFVGGMPALARPLQTPFPRLDNPAVSRLDDDLIVWGRLAYGDGMPETVLHRAGAGGGAHRDSA
ncbi:MAG: RibD family protein [Chloroflexi bacterium]|nr:RibD family protein [Chloroflexota bacterium]